MFERFTEKAIKVIMLAQEEARRLGHNFVGTEQILLGLIHEGTGIAAKALKARGVNLKDARVEAEKIIGRGSGFVAVEIPFTPRAKRVLELAWQDARSFGHNYIGTEHLLLGIIRESEGVAARILENLGLTLDTLKLDVLRLMGEAGQNVTAKKELANDLGQEDKNAFSKEEIDKKLLGIYTGCIPIEFYLAANDLAVIKLRKEQAIRNQQFDMAASLRERESQIEYDLKEQLGTKQDLIPKQKAPAFDKFTDGVLKALLLARKESRRQGVNHVGAEQMFVALIEENTGITGKVFQSTGVYLEEARLACETIIGKCDYPDSNYLQFAPSLNAAFLLSEKKAADYGLLYVRKEHLLLALLEVEHEVIASLRKNLSIDKKRMKEELSSLMKEKNSEES